MQTFAAIQAVRFFFKCYIYFVFPEELSKNTTRWHPMKIKNKTSGPSCDCLKLWKNIFCSFKCTGSERKSKNKVYFENWKALFTSKRVSLPPDFKKFVFKRVRAVTLLPTCRYPSSNSKNASSKVSVIFAQHTVILEWCKYDVKHFVLKI